MATAPGPCWGGGGDVWGEDLGCLVAGSEPAAAADTDDVSRCDDLLGAGMVGRMEEKAARSFSSSRAPHECSVRTLASLLLSLFRAPCQGART